MKEIMILLIPDPVYFGENMGNDIWAYTEDQLVEYGKDCRNAALDEVIDLVKVLKDNSTDYILDRLMDIKHETNEDQSIKPIPESKIYEIYNTYYRPLGPVEFVRAIEEYHGIKGDNT